MNKSQKTYRRLRVSDAQWARNDAFPHKILLCAAVLFCINKFGRESFARSALFRIFVWSLRLLINKAVCRNRKELKTMSRRPPKETICPLPP